MLLVIIVVLIVLLLTYELFYERKLKACARRLPGFPMIPLLGNAHQFKPTPTDGTEIPAECSILFNIFSMNRNPEVFPDPMKFIPERFSLEESSKRHNFSIITLSAGQRNCIGQKFAMTEIKCIFSKCIKELEFLPGDIELELGFDLVLNSYNGVNLRIRKRH